MNPYYYDLHIHSCLSPCGDDDMTPGNIVGMAALKQLDVIAITDHNSCKNCPAILSLANEYGITAIPGMELTTTEEVHVVCLFFTLEDALSFDAYVEKRILPIPNVPETFGKQEIRDRNDELIGTFPTLLISATSISFDDVFDLMEQFHGVMIPAHIEKNSFSLLSNLGFVPPDSRFTCFELKNLSTLHSVVASNPYLNHCKVITNSDAHYLEHINEPINTLYAKSCSISDILCSLKKG